MTGSYVVGIQEIDRTQLAIVGGKAAGLGELARIAGARVPPGFVVTTHAFARIVADAAIAEPLDRLTRLARSEDREVIRAASAELRARIEATAIPDAVAAAITGALGEAAYAVRSSATAEDLPTASFAGQQDTYLNVVGPAAILAHVRRCWASLFTERAVTYRQRHGFDHRKVAMAVVVQEMVAPAASGVLFTADPVTGNRKVASVEACFGLGEAVVSGLVIADAYQVRDARVVKTIATKPRAFYAAPGGGTEPRAIAPERQAEPVLTDAQVIELVRLGWRIEAWFGRPQDLEWCLVDGDFQIVQSRPITTLFPIPVAQDDAPHVYLSVGHHQMMTDPLRPLGLSLFQLTALRPMSEAGGRLFVDVARGLASPAGRAGLLAMIGRSEPLTGDALRTVIERGFVPDVPDEPAPAVTAPVEPEPAIVAALIARSEASLAILKRDIQTRSGPALFDFVLADLQELKRLLFDPQSHQAIMAGIEATWWLTDQLQVWLGETNAADPLVQSVPGNVTSEMGLALLDVADAIRPYPEVVAFLARAGDDFLDALPALAGGREARDAIAGYLDRYGMRCVGEIDITRPRWRERPATLVPALLGNIKRFAPGARDRRFARGQQVAATHEAELLARLRGLADGERKAAEVKQRIDRIRAFAGYREYPKYLKINRYFVYKQALLAEAARLVEAGVVRDAEDIYYLTFHELHDVVRTHQLDAALIVQRKAAFRAAHALTPPRVLTSEGEVITGSYRRAVPAGALVGLAVSAGTIEGRARVIHDLAAADLEPGDILVTAFTDPSWTPLFVAIAGLVTEVGGLMSHGAVIAREYGLPAIVGVEGATQRIGDGQRIRVHASDGYVELLGELSGD